MQLISKYNERIRFLLKAFQKILDESDCKPSKLWVDKGQYNRSMKSWLHCIDC